MSAVVRAVAQLDEQAVRDGLDVLEETHGRVLAALAAHPEIAPADVAPLLRDIDEAIAVYRARLTAIITGRQAEADVLADEHLAQATARAGLSAGIVGLAPTTLATLGEITADLVTRITTDARTAIARELRIATLGGADFGDLMARIGRNLDDPSVFGTLRGRSEAIARTEVHRAYATGYAARAEDLARRFPGLRKRWRHTPARAVPRRPGSGQAVSRPEHVALDGTTIPWEDTFAVGGERARWPHDPRLSARQSVNCRCVLELDFSQVDMSSTTAYAPAGLRAR